VRFLRAALRYSEIGECTYRDRERSLTRDTDNRNPSDKDKLVMVLRVAAESRRVGCGGSSEVKCVHCCYRL